MDITIESLKKALNHKENLFQQCQDTTTPPDGNRKLASIRQTLVKICHEIYYHPFKDSTLLGMKGLWTAILAGKQEDTQGQVQQCQVCQLTMLATSLAWHWLEVTCTSVFNDISAGNVHGGTEWLASLMTSIWQFYSVSLGHLLNNM